MYDDEYRPEDDLPTPEQELSWAIHNDHADGSEADSPDMRDDDFDFDVSDADLGQLAETQAWVSER